MPATFFKSQLENVEKVFTINLLRTLLDCCFFCCCQSIDNDMWQIYSNAIFTLPHIHALYSQYFSHIYSHICSAIIACPKEFLYIYVCIHASCHVWFKQKIELFSRRRWNRTTEHVSSPTDLKSALHTSEGHPRCIFCCCYDYCCECYCWLKYAFFQHFVDWNTFKTIFRNLILCKMFQFVCTSYINPHVINNHFCKHFV